MAGTEIETPNQLDARLREMSQLQKSRPVHDASVIALAIPQRQTVPVNWEDKYERSRL